MAFETIVKKQIEKLKEPSLACIDMVVTELTNVVRTCTEKVPLIPFTCRLSKSAITVGLIIVCVCVFFFILLIKACLFLH